MSKILSILAPACRLCAGGGPGMSTSRCRENRGREFQPADLLLSINYFWALPRIPERPPGDSDASRDSAVALSVGKNLNNSIGFHYLFSASVRLFSLNVVI